MNASRETPDFQVRSATESDTEPLADLLRGMGLFKRMERESREETIENVRRHLLQSLADGSHTVLVAKESSGDLLGYVAAHWLPYLILAGPEGFVSELFVAESARGLGIGTALMNAVVDEAKSRGCSRLQLINFRDRESYRRGYYTKLGWHERPDAADFIHDIAPRP